MCSFFKASSLPMFSPMYYFNFIQEVLIVSLFFPYMISYTGLFLFLLVLLLFDVPVVLHKILNFRNRLGHSHRMYDYRAIRPYLIVDVLATRMKCLKLSAYSIVIICASTFHTTNVFGYFRNVFSQFELIKHKFTNRTMLFVYVSSF